MNELQAKEMAHELTIEYIKSVHLLNDGVIDNIPRIVDKVAEINQKFYDAVLHNETLN